MYAHTCGEIAEITPPVYPCPNGHRGAWRLTDWQQRGSRWVWRCMTCRAADPRSVATMWCRSCGNGQMSLRRSNSQDLHYAQQITALNPPTRAEHANLVSEHLPKAAIAQALGLLQPGKEGLRKAGLIADSDGRGPHPAGRRPPRPGRRRPDAGPPDRESAPHQRHAPPRGWHRWTLWGSRANAWRWSARNEQYEPVRAAT